MNMLSARWHRHRAMRAERKAVPRIASGDSRASLWMDLAEAAADANAFYHPALLIPALDLLDRDGRVRVLEAWDGDRLIGLLPVEPHSHHGRFRVAHCRNHMHIHCFFGVPLLRAGCEEAAWQLLLAQLDRAEWSGMFLHLSGQDPASAAMQALERLCEGESRLCTQIDAYARATLESDLDAEQYWTEHVRAKKRKELRRLVHRLEELGEVRHHRLESPGDLPRWCEDFLTLEASGWKGERGTALVCNKAHRDYFRAICTNAQVAGMLDMLRIDLDGRAIAMLVNFRHLRGSFSFKIAIDENFGRFSPGVLIEIDNLHAVQGDPALDWMDSCAKADHSMIDSLWAERRTIAQYRVMLKGRGMRRIARASTLRAIGLAQRAITNFRSNHR